VTSRAAVSGYGSFAVFAAQDDTRHHESNVSDAKRRILSLMKPYELGLLIAIGNVTA